MSRRARGAPRKLAESGISLVCVKLGDGGCVFASGGLLTHVPPTPVKAVDATGAGDALTGALAVVLLEGRTQRQAVLFATAASHLAVSGYGSQEAYPDRARIDALVPRLAEQVHVLEP